MQQEEGHLSRTLFSSAHTPGDSALHRLPAFWKIALALLLTAGAVLGGWPGIAVLAASVLAGACLARYSLFQLLKKLKSILWFCLIAGLFPVLFTTGTPVQPGLPLDLSWEGLEIGAQNTSRVALMFLLSLLFIHTTDPKAWLSGMHGHARSGGWESSLREIGAVAGLALQLLPLLCIEADRWVSQNTGNNKLNGNVFHKARQVASWLVPLVVSVLADMERMGKRV